jgi:hypothetical protein
MSRFLVERIHTLTPIFIARLDEENTDNLHEVVVQYMHENGMTFDILSEDAESIKIKDEDGTVITYGLVENPKGRDFMFSEFMLECLDSEDEEDAI